MDSASGRVWNARLAYFGLGANWRSRYLETLFVRAEAIQG